jgi:hypothetical protein
LNYDETRQLDDDQIENLKEELFVQFGDDVDDVWVAFRHYRLDPEVTPKDMDKYTGI